MPKHVFKNSCPFSSIFIYIASITTLLVFVVALRDGAVVVAVTDGAVVVLGLPEDTEYFASNPRSSEEPERKLTNIFLPLEYTSSKTESLQNRPSEGEFAEEPSYSSTLVQLSELQLNSHEPRANSANTNLTSLPDGTVMIQEQFLDAG